MKSKVLVVMAIIIVALAGIALVYLYWGEGENAKTNEAKNDNFSVMYEGVEVAPGNAFSRDSINEEADFVELESCAFDGTDKVYTYENVEIMASEMKGVETVYSVYFLNDMVETKEGVKITDEKSKVIDAYGENYEEIGNELAYKKGKVRLSFIVENDIVTSIEYVYIIE
jgi:hypothetical protein